MKPSSADPALAPASNDDRPPTVNLLIVDDIPQNLVAMEALLRREDVHILKAGSGAEALELLLEHDVALALLDVQMPEMDGFALAELMRGSQRTRDVPIIFLTASPSDPVRSFKGYESGAVDFLHKPIDPRVIRGKVNVFIELYQQRLQLRARNDRLERALTLNETMIAVLTHDLRTPLSVITLCADSLRQKAGDGPLGKTLGHLEASAHRMARMVGQLLDFSRIRSDVLQLEWREGDMGEIARTAVTELRQAHPQARVELSTEGSLQGRFDTDRMVQVLTNLLGNAIVHGTDETPVRVAVDGRDARTLRIGVRNAGQVPAELLPRLFEPFKSAHRRSDGLGLGLYIVDQFVRAHGGQASVGNTEAGVLFEVAIPRGIGA
ncbi:hybrid sensor histidine kinase/response regulator [Frateuria hangzhouensis]|uniref:hybrid sensor histidine kinase/response regulator n=1 Tax=Frateuria hangzhouensis TaxID=2995589 RepID=UPI002B214A4B|nr:response regulator [Frateuria sp. STR12]